MSLRPARETKPNSDRAPHLPAKTGDQPEEAAERLRSIADPSLMVASRRINGRGKRAFDITIGAAAAAFTLPLVLTLAIALRLDGHGPAIVRSQRIGRRGKPFTQLGFRAPAAFPAQWRTAFATSFVARLPSLLNVLRGDLSLVGPKPVDRDGLVRYGGDRRFYLVARPGFTTPWRRDDVREANLAALCRDYVLNWRLRRDLAVLRAAIFDSPRPRAP